MGCEVMVGTVYMGVQVLGQGYSMLVFFFFSGDRWYMPSGFGKMMVPCGYILVLLFWYSVL